MLIICFRGCFLDIIKINWILQNFSKSFGEGKISTQKKVSSPLDKLLSEQRSFGIKKSMMDSKDDSQRTCSLAMGRTILQEIFTLMQKNNKKSTKIKKKRTTPNLMKKIMSNGRRKIYRITTGTTTAYIQSLSPG